MQFFSVIESIVHDNCIWAAVIKPEISNKQPWARWIEAEHLWNGVDGYLTYKNYMARCNEADMFLFESMERGPEFPGWKLSTP